MVCSPCMLVMLVDMVCYKDVCVCVCVCVNGTHQNIYLNHMYFLPLPMEIRPSPSFSRAVPETFHYHAKF